MPDIIPLFGIWYSALEVHYVILYKHIGRYCRNPSKRDVRANLWTFRFWSVSNSILNPNITQQWKRYYNGKWQMKKRRKRVNWNLDEAIIQFVKQKFNVKDSSFLRPFHQLDCKSLWMEKHDDILPWWMIWSSYDYLWYGKNNLCFQSCSPNPTIMKRSQKEGTIIQSLVINFDQHCSGHLLQQCAQLFSYRKYFELHDFHTK